MKNLRILTITCLLGLLTIGYSQAQNLRSGVKGGLNVSNLYIDEADDENPRYGFNIGVFTQLGDGAFVLQPELNYTTKGTKTTYGGDFFDGEADFNLNYLELPLLFTFKLGDGADIHIGPYAGYLVGSNFKSSDNFFSTDIDLDRDNFKNFDFGLSGGMALNFDAISVGARYNYGLTKIAESQEAKDLLGSSKNSVAQLYVALNLN
ncbi:porin family protein [Fulvivirga sp.]|uniref:porin family protein n=1 Tax=Fulvivirga sp. TaxID=1931237 RepID=UPI0032EF9C84